MFDDSGHVFIEVVHLEDRDRAGLVGNAFGCGCNRKRAVARLQLNPTIIVTEAKGQTYCTHPEVSRPPHVCSHEMNILDP